MKKKNLLDLASRQVSTKSHIFELLVHYSRESFPDSKKTYIIDYFTKSDLKDFTCQ